LIVSHLSSNVGKKAAWKEQTERLKGSKSLKLRTYVLCASEGGLIYGRSR